MVSETLMPNLDYVPIIIAKIGKLRQTDGQTDRQKYSHTGRQTYIQTYSHTDIQADILKV